MVYCRQKNFIICQINDDQQKGQTDRQKKREAKKEENKNTHLIRIYVYCLFNECH